MAVDGPIGKRRQKICFVICEVQDKGSPQRKHADSVFNNIIKPALGMRGTQYKVVRIDKKCPGGDITQAIVEDLRTADLVIVDLTNLNPNVMYELGIRQAWNLPLVPIALDGQKLPFDLAVLNTVFYKSAETKSGATNARKEIRKQIKNILKGETKNVIFEQSISSIGKSYSMDAVYEAFKDALKDMHKSLEGFRHDLLHGDVWRDRESLEDSAEKLAKIFRSMSDKAHIFRQIAMRDIFDPESLDMRLVRLLAKTDKLTQDGNKIAKVIMSGAADKQKKVLRRTDILLSKIRQMGSILSHKK